MIDYYAKLGLKSNATQEDIQANISKVQSPEHRKAIQYILLNKNRRKIYDKNRNTLKEIGQLRANLRLGASDHWRKDENGDFFTNRDNFPPLLVQLENLNETKEEKQARPPKQPRQTNQAEYPAQADSSDRVWLYIFLGALALAIISSVIHNSGKKTTSKQYTKTSYSQKAANDEPDRKLPGTTAANGKPRIELPGTTIFSEHYEEHCFEMYDLYNKAYEKYSTPQYQKAKDAWREEWAVVREARLIKIVRSAVGSDLSDSDLETMIQIYEELLLLKPNNIEYQNALAYYVEKAEQGKLEKMTISQSSRRSGERQIYVSSERHGEHLISIHILENNGSSEYIKTQIDCAKGRYRILGKGKTAETINTAQSGWYEAQYGTSNYDLIKYICPEHTDIQNCTVSKFDFGAIYYAHGSNVHGDQFGFMKYRAKPEADVLRITWTTYDEGIVNLKGEDVTIKLVVDNVEYEVVVPYVYTNKLFEGSDLNIFVMSNFIVNPEFIDLLSRSKEVKVILTAPKELVQKCDFAEQTFLLDGFAEARKKAIELLK